jgi:hypothetical protein
LIHLLQLRRKLTQQEDQQEAQVSSSNGKKAKENAANELTMAKLTTWNLAQMMVGTDRNRPFYA